MARLDKEKESRFHIHLCESALDPAHRIKLNMGYIENDRAKRYSRMDSIAGKAYRVRLAIENVESAITDLLQDIKKESGK